MPLVDASILIVSWNVKPHVLACIGSVVKHTTELSYETILIDNNSEDGTVAAVKLQFPRVQVIENRKNVGFAAANNQGLQVALGRYLILLNPDTELLENSFRKMLDFLESHPQIGALGCKMVNSAGEIDYQCAKRMPTIANHGFEPYVGKIFPGLMKSFVMHEWDHNENREVELLSGACLAIGREVYEAVGGLDEEMFMYVEDVDYCWRIRQAGWRLYFLADTTIIHHGGQSTKQKKDALHAENVRNLRKFFSKHRSWLYGCTFEALLLCEYLIKYFMLSGLRLLNSKYRTADVRQYLNVFLELLHRP